MWKHKTQATRQNASVPQDMERVLVTEDGNYPVKKIFSSICSYSGRCNADFLQSPLFHYRNRLNFLPLSI